MYIAKVYLDKQLMDVALYEGYEHFLSDLTSSASRLYSHIPKERAAATDFERPWIIAGGEDSLGFGCDYEYRYGSGMTVYCGTAFTEEDMARCGNEEDNDDTGR